MVIKKRYIKFILITVLVFLSDLTYGADITISLLGSINKNGSGKIDYTYSAKGTSIKNYMLGDYVFAPKIIEKRFTSSNSSVEKSGFYRRQTDTSIYVSNVILDFQDLNKINQAVGFSNVKASWTNTDSGNVFRWVIPATSNSVSISHYSYKFTFESDVLSSNGQVVKDNTVTWYKDKGIDPNKDIVLTALIKSERSGPTGDQKSCGLFGIELPVLMFAGYIFSFWFKKKKNC